MTSVYLLSDTTYRQQAVKQLHQLLGNNNQFPVEPSQIYGLRQIARQEPGRIEKFASHQGGRAQSRYDAEEKRKAPNTDALQKWGAEIKFWTLVTNLCGDSPNHWSVQREGLPYLPRELRDENLCEVKGATPQETQKNQQHNNKIKKGQQEWLNTWNNEHIPAFFERFCTHCLFCIAKAEMGQLGSVATDETHQLSQQEQNDNQDGGAMQTAWQQVNLVE